MTPTARVDVEKRQEMSRAMKRSATSFLLRSVRCGSGVSHLSAGVNDLTCLVSLPMAYALWKPTPLDNKSFSALSVILSAAAPSRCDCSMDVMSPYPYFSDLFGGVKLGPLRESLRNCCADCTADCRVEQNCTITADGTFHLRQGLGAPGFGPEQCRIFLLHHVFTVD